METIDIASDEEMASALAQLRTATTSLIAVCATAFTAAIYERPTDEAEWHLVCRGDLGRDSAKELKRWVRPARLYWEQGVGDAPTLSIPVGPMTAADLRDQLSQRNHRASHREGHISKANRDQLAAEAAHRCQFTGCGESLLEAGAPHSAGHYGYAAHIVAASPEGPRGHPEQSKQLAADPTNIILLCDKHHVLIDRIAPAMYTVARLRAMREDSRERVRSLLGTLRFPVARTMQLIGSIEGQLGTIDRVERDHALWGLELSPGEGNLHLGEIGVAAAQVHSEAFWLSIFSTLRDDITRIRQAVAKTDQGEIVFFGLHATSVLILFGRLLGNSAAIRVQQLHRDELPGTRWTWPRSPAPFVAARELATTTTAPAAGATCAVLVVALTANIPQADIPSHCLAGGAGVCRIDARAPSHRFVGSAEAMRAIADHLDDALRLMIDDWRVSTIHLLVVAPVSVCVTLGQKIQARHQPHIIIYERVPTLDGSRGAFAPVIGITAMRVTHLASSQSRSLTAEAS
ncbi:SAVED domain-containing protein [Luteibacter sp. Lutesp34]|uniref:SAVED domain-containing protein n=1 Tax=Luteibacter sp. Lutesp34 TaxID=3243030 RepID=UPI0039B5C0A1